MKRTLQEQIQANRRGSIILTFLLVLILAALGTVMVGTYAPRHWYFGTAGAAALGGLMALIANAAGPGILLGIAHAREATHDEDRVLDNVVEEMAIASGMPKPKIYVIDDYAPNAFSTGNNPQSAVIAVTTGLLDKLDRDELQGIVAHEMAHIRNYDTKFMTTVSLVAGLIPMLSDVFLRMQWFGGGRSRDDDRDSNQLGAIFQIVGIVLAILAPIFAFFLEIAISRKREYLADATAAEMTRYPEGLARALRKIAMDPDPYEYVNRATQYMYVVNPMHLDGSGGVSTEDRIKALMSLAGTSGNI